MTGKDTKALKDLMTWLRREKIAYSTISAGGITLDGVVDLKQVDDAKPTKDEPKPTMYQKFGGALLAQPTVKKGATVPDEAMTDD